MSKMSDKSIEMLELVDDFGDFIEAHSDALQETEPFVITQMILLLINSHLNMGRFTIKELETMDKRKYAKNFERAIAEYSVQRFLDGILLESLKREDD